MTSAAAPPMPDVASGRSRNKSSNRRAGLVCVRCHEKKIKCDLQVHTGQEPQKCKNCTNSNSPCQLRPSRRGTGKRQSNRANVIPSPPDPTNQVDPQLPTQVPESSYEQPQDVSRIYNHPSFPFDPSIDQGITSSSGGRQLQDLNSTHQQSEHDQAIYGLLQFAGQAHVADAEIPTATPGQESTSVVNPQQTSYVGDTGYMQIFSHGSTGEDGISPGQASVDGMSALEIISPALQESYIDAYFEYGYVWCPLLDRETLRNSSEVLNSAIIRHALALCGNQLRPPLIQHADSLSHYNRAKSLFYGNDESNPILRISAIMLFYWWSAVPLNIVSMDSNWWWTGVAIRLAQEIGLNREPRPGQYYHLGDTPGLRRRIWWTLFARERLTAVSQGRPCIIDPDYCDVRMLTVDDFPDPTDQRAEIFVKFIHLCDILGRIGKCLYRTVDGPSPTAPLARDLMDWVKVLPDHLLLPVSGPRTNVFNRDIHGLHLVYLATVTLLHLSKSGRPLPKASLPAIAAASCTARIFEDFLARGSVRFLAGQAGWYITMAILALLSARRVDGLTAYADADIRTLRAALKQMALLWHSAKMFDQGFEKLLAAESSPANVFINPVRNGNRNANGNSNLGHPGTSQTLDELATSDGVNWLDYFPYITAQTSPLIGAILASNMEMPFSNLDWSFDLAFQPHDLFVWPDNLQFDGFNP